MRQSTSKNAIKSKRLKLLNKLQKVLCDRKTVLLTILVVMIV